MSLFLLCGAPVMERQRSLFFKPTRVILVCFTLSSSLALCIFFYCFILGGYSSLWHEKDHIPLGSSLEPAVGGRFSNCCGDHSNETALERYGFEEKRDLGSDSQDASESYTLQQGEGSNEHSDSSIGMKDVDLGDTHFRKTVEFAGGGGKVSKVASFSLPKVEARRSWFEGGNSSSGAFVEDPSQVWRAVTKGKIESCDIYKGRWIFDPSLPLYSNETCPFIDEGFNCQSNGRPDQDYRKWRWQPSGCNLPRFDAVRMLETIRGKRLVFAGDSINRNQWESLLCMLRQGISDPKRMYEAHGRRITKGKGVYNFKFPDYQCSVEFYVTHFLVHEGRAKIGKKRVSTLRIDSVDRSLSKWRKADILVFNTAHWWSHYKTKAGRNYFQEGDVVHPQLDVAVAFRRALMTWASWIDQNIDPKKTRIFFRSSSPSHYRGGSWNAGGHCRESTHPLNETWTRDSPTINVIVDEVLGQMKIPVTVLNVTALSGLRIDGHPSVYGKNPGFASSRRSIQDCSHWCLPGVPDVWNQLLYYNLLYMQLL